MLAGEHATVIKIGYADLSGDRLMALVVVVQLIDCRARALWAKAEHPRQSRSQGIHARDIQYHVSVRGHPHSRPRAANMLLPAMRIVIRLFLTHDFPSERFDRAVGGLGVNKPRLWADRHYLVA